MTKVITNIEGKRKLKNDDIPAIDKTRAMCYNIRA